MARRKNAPDLVKVKVGVAERLRDLRSELYGDRGGPELARGLGLPVRTWYNYEGGVTVPAEVILRLIEITQVEATWLLHGLGPKFRDVALTKASPAESVESLLRTALKRLESAVTPRGSRSSPGLPAEPLALADDSDLILVRVDDALCEPLSLALASGPGYIAARSEWQVACREHRCLRVTDDAMAPLIASGAYVAYADRDAEPPANEGRLVVAWLDGKPPVVRWFHHAGRVAILRSESDPSATTTVDLDDEDAPPRFRHVAWISTPR